VVLGGTASSVGRLISWPDGETSGPGAQYHNTKEGLPQALSAPERRVRLAAPDSALAVQEKGEAREPLIARSPG
jgi:hypothetical protein